MKSILVVLIVILFVCTACHRTMPVTSHPNISQQGDLLVHTSPPSAKDTEFFKSGELQMCGPYFWTDGEQLIVKEVMTDTWELLISIHNIQLKDIFQIKTDDKRKTPHLERGEILSMSTSDYAQSTCLRTIKTTAAIP